MSGNRAQVQAPWLAVTPDRCPVLSSGYNNNQLITFRDAIDMNLVLIFCIGNTSGNSEIPSVVTTYQFGFVAII